MKIELKYPIELDGKESNEKIVIKELTFTRIKAKHIKVIPSSCFEEGGGTLKPNEVIPLVAALSNITEEAADELDIVDLKYITGEVLPTFLAEFQQVDEKDSK